MENKYEEKILKTLVERSRLGEISGKSGYSRMKPESIYPQYGRPSGSYEKTAAVNKAVSFLESRGFVTASREKYGSRITTVRIRKENVEAAESWLTKEYAYETVPLRKVAVDGLLTKYESASPSCAAECRKIKAKGKPPKTLSEIEKQGKILETVRFLETNKKDTYIRAVSETLFSDTKVLERGLLDKAFAVIRRHDASAASLEKLELLNRCHILFYPQEIFMKGDFSISINGKTADASGFSDGIRFSSTDACRIDEIGINTGRFVTVENKTSFFQCCDENTVFFFLGGFAADAEISLIKKIYADNPEISYQHFGDIDAGGFRIHNDLCNKTGIPFKMLHMGIPELKKYEKYGKKLEGDDRKRLNELPELYAETAAYMIKNNIKLEQEAVALRL